MFTTYDLSRDQTSADDFSIRMIYESERFGGICENDT